MAKKKAKKKAAKKKTAKKKTAKKKAKKKPRRRVPRSAKLASSKRGRWRPLFFLPLYPEASRETAPCRPTPERG